MRQNTSCPVPSQLTAVAGAVAAQAIPQPPQWALSRWYFKAMI